jgi:small-conductance mechanosensitive channel
MSYLIAADPDAGQFVDPSRFEHWIPFIAVVTIVIAVWYVSYWLLLRRKRERGDEQRFPVTRLFMVILAIAGFVISVLSLPFPATTISGVFAALGLVLSLAIALSSTTFVANAMAGLMLRGVRSFRTGDFIRVGEQFGRVTERGFFHTEIQTEDRDLVTLPNMYLVTNPVKVVRYSGTVVSANLSLGYDVPHSQVTSLLLEAARGADLQDPFVQILSLGDYSVTYRIAGVLKEVKQLLSSRSKLRATVLTTLHGAGIEIASPQIMNQRRLAEGQRILPPGVVETAGTDEVDVPEEKIFDKANEAERVEKLRLDRDNAAARIVELKTLLRSTQEDQRARLEQEIAHLQQVVEEIGKTLESDDCENGSKG